MDYHSLSSVSHDVTVLTDHSAVKAILQTPNLSGKHARWWTKVYGSGVKDVKIQYRPGRLNSSADALSPSPQSPSVTEAANHDVHVATVMSIPSESTTDIATLLNADPEHQRALLMSSARTRTYLRSLTSYRRNNFPKKRNEPERLLFKRHFSPLQMTCCTMWTQNRNTRSELPSQDTSRSKS